MNPSCTVSDLRCDARVNPLGTGDTAPRLSWKITDEDADRRGLTQAAYRVRVASSLELLGTAPDFWDSGTVASDRSVDVLYAGSPPASCTRVYWSVAVTDETGAVATSEPAFWETGLFAPDEWQGARWVGGTLTGGPRTTVPAPYLRKSFLLTELPRNARLYITALGVYEATINGVRVGESILTPGWTDYGKRVQYQTYDVTDHLSVGENVLGAILGDGWYCGHVGGGARQVYGERPYLLAVLRVGDTVIVSDESWHTATGAILESDFLMGESFDARREPTGWNMPGYDQQAHSWQAVSVLPDPGVDRSPMLAEPVRYFEELTPVADPQEIPGWPQPTYVYDFGQNLVGNVRLQITGTAGTTVRLRFAEVLEGGPAATTGKIYTANLRGARCTDYLTLKGDPGGETWTPRFTFHGFRFAELNIFPPSHPTTIVTHTVSKPGRGAVTAIVAGSDTPKTGDFECSDPLLNRLQKNIDWGQRGNFFEVPTDCPQRDERLGWTGDAQVFIRTAAFNRDVQSFFHKWGRDLADAQSENGTVPSVIPNPDPAGGNDGGPAWADAAVICPWTIYLTYGDTAMLETHYDSMARFVKSLDLVMKDGIRSYDGMPGHHGFGDWLAQDGTGRVDGGTPKSLIGTAFVAYDAQIMAKVARILGKTTDAARYDTLFETSRQTFLKRFVTPDGLVYPGTQTAYVLALHFGLLPDTTRENAVNALVADIKSRGHKLTTGFVGSPYLPHVLSDNGRADIAYKLLHQKNWPSYLYAVTQGATTIWERWDGWTHDKGFQDAGMNSFNHYAYGAIGDWMYQKVAGIAVDETRPGYKHIVFKPIPFGSGLTHARARLETAYGRVESAWLIENDTFAWRVVVPPNTTATVHLPVELAGKTVTENGKAVIGSVLELVAGRYRFVADL